MTNSATPAPRRAWSLRTRLLAVVLAGTVIFVPGVAYVAYSLSNDALTASVDGRLQAIARVLVTGIERAGAGWIDSTASLAESRQTREALAQFRTAFGKVTQEVPLNDSAWTRIGGDLREHYNRRLWQPLGVTRGGKMPEREGWLPGREGMLLQTIEFGGGSRVERLLATADPLRLSFAPSSYARAVEIHEPVWRDYAQRADLVDLLLIDADGTVLYALAKTPLIGQSLVSQLHQASVPAQMFRAAMRLGADRRNRALISDVVPSEWHGDDPSLWIAAAVTDDIGRRVGAILSRVSASRSLDPLVSFGQREAEVGLGETGSAMLVGRNGTLRTNYRFASRLPAGSVRPLLQPDDKPTITTAATYRLPPNFPVLQSMFGSAIEREGVMNANDDTGAETRLAYRRVRVSDLPWGVIVQLTRKEGVAGAERLRNYLGGAATALCLIGGLVLWVTVSSMTAPLRALAQAADRMRNGDFTARAAVRRQDEVGIAATAANKMADALFAENERRKAEYETLARNVELLSRITTAVGEGDLTSRAAPMTGPVAPLAESLNRAQDVLSRLLGGAVQLARFVAAQAADVTTQQEQAAAASEVGEQASWAAHNEAAQSQMAMQKVTVSASTAQGHAASLRQCTEEGMAIAQSVEEGMRTISAGARQASRRLQQSAEKAMQFEAHIEEITKHAKKVGSLATNVQLALRTETNAETRTFLGEIRSLAERSIELAASCATDFTTLVGEIHANLIAAEEQTVQIDGHASAVEGAREAQGRTLEAGQQSQHMLSQLNDLVMEVDGRLGTAAAESRRSADEASRGSRLAQETLQAVTLLSEHASQLVQDTQQLRLSHT